MVMMPIQGRLVAGPSLPTLSAPYWTHLRHYLQPVGVDRAWDICSGMTGISLTQDVRGLHWPDVDLYTAEAPGVHGAREHGYRIKPRECYLPVEMYRDGTREWMQLYRRFFSDINFRRHVWWVAVNEQGGWRRLKLRFTPDGAQQFEQAPEYVGWTEFGLYATATQPLWEGPAITRPWGNTSSLTMFEGGNINIAASASIGDATIDNPGDEPAPVQLTVVGPWADGFAVTIDGRRIVLDKALADGERVIIDTSDTGAGIYSPAGANLTRQWAREFDQVTVPAGGIAQVLLEGSGDGGASMSLTPLYHDGFPTDGYISDGSDATAAVTPI